MTWRRVTIGVQRIRIQRTRFPCRSVHWPGRRGVCELDHGRHDPAPGCRSVIITGEREFVSSGSAFVEGLLSVALAHQLRRPPNVDLGYHAIRVAPTLSIKV